MRWLYGVVLCFWSNIVFAVEKVAVARWDDPNLTWDVVGNAFDVIMARVFTDEVLLSAIVTLIASIYAILRRKAGIKSKKVSDCMDWLEDGCEHAWNVFVKECKKKAADGKLTAEERKTAYDIAVNAAVAQAKEHGYKLFDVLSEDHIPVIIRKIIRSRLKPKK